MTFTPVLILGCHLETFICMLPRKSEIDLLNPNLALPFLSQTLLFEAFEERER